MPQYSMYVYISMLIHVYVHTSYLEYNGDKKKNFKPI